VTTPSPRYNTDPGDEGGLPFIDEHTMRLTAEPDDVWTALGGLLAHPRGPIRAFGIRLLRAQPAHRTGDPLKAGSTLPGFAVVRAEQPTVLALHGSHRFSRYALAFRLEPDAGATIVRAQTHALFPGAAGRIYRMMVIGTGGHTIAVRGLLAELTGRAEAAGVHRLPRVVDAQDGVPLLGAAAR